MRKNTVLVIEDNANLVCILTAFLEDLGFKHIHSYTGSRGCNLAKRKEVSLIILDVGLPDISGYRVIEKIRKFSNIPIIIISNDTSISNQKLSFQNKANVFHSKPIDYSLLEIQIGNLINRVDKKRRYLEINKKTKIDLYTQSILINKKEIQLTSNEFNFLQLLLKNREQIISREKIIDTINTNDIYVGNSTVDAMVCRLRKKLGCSVKNSIIETVNGRGYRIKIS